jgi:hypothetical protein
MVNQSANKVRLKLIEKMFGNTAALPGMQIRQLPVLPGFRAGPSTRRCDNASCREFESGYLFSYNSAFPLQISP